MQCITVLRNTNALLLESCESCVCHLGPFSCCLTFQPWLICQLTKTHVTDKKIDSLWTLSHSQANLENEIALNAVIGITADRCYSLTYIFFLQNDSMTLKYDRLNINGDFESPPSLIPFQTGENMLISECLGRSVAKRVFSIFLIWQESYFEKLWIIYFISI